MCYRERVVDEARIAFAHNAAVYVEQVLVFFVTRERVVDTARLAFAHSAAAYANPQP
jgi:hypothetical protein